MPVTKAQAAAELLRRREARQHLINFNQYTFEGYLPSAPRRLICQYLDAVHAGLIKRLMVFVPPQYGKSTIISRRFPPYGLGKNSDDRYLLISYAADLAIELSKDARSVIRDPSYAALFGHLAAGEQQVALDPSSQSSSFWRIDGRRGGLTASGIGGAITGRGAKYLLIDDPVKNFSEARSRAVQARNYNEYHSTLKTRLTPDGRIVLLMTRWDDEDLAGKILKEQRDPGGEKFVVLRLPLVAETRETRRKANEMMHIIEEPDPLGHNPADDPLGRKPGEPLDPERHDQETAQRILDGPPSVVTSIWQQAPRPVEGNLIKREWFEVVATAPADLEVTVRAWDLAATEKETASQDPDWTVGLKLGRKKVGSGYLYFILDLVKAQASPRGVEQLLLQTANLDTPALAIGIEREGGATGKSYASTVRALLAGFNVRFYPPSGDKVLRANPWISEAEAGNVKLVYGPWIEEFLREADAFPDGAHDDQIDAMSLAFYMVTRAGVGRKVRSHG